MPKPSICRMVVARVDPAVNSGGPAEAPALITRVHGPGAIEGTWLVNLRVFVDNPGSSLRQTSVTLFDSEGQADGFSHACWWPPRT